MIVIFQLTKTGTLTRNKFNRLAETKLSVMKCVNFCVIVPRLLPLNRTLNGVPRHLEFTSGCQFLSDVTFYIPTKFQKRMSTGGLVSLLDFASVDLSKLEMTMWVKMWLKVIQNVKSQKFKHLYRKSMSFRKMVITDFGPEA